MNMNPSDLKNIFGLKDEKDVNMANNIWKMLDDMATSDPDQYNKFIEKNIKEGFDDAKQKKEERDKPFKVKVKTGFSMSMTANLNEKPLESAINQKVLITKEPWSEVKKKFADNVRIVLNIAHSDRVKPSKAKSTGKEIQKYSVKMLQDIEFFYYSLQGPVADEKEKNKMYFCMILNNKFYDDLLNEPAGKKTLMGLCLSYFQERLERDKNSLLKMYNPEQHRRLAFYNVDKFSIQINEKSYNFLGKNEPEQFLLEKEVDTKRQAQIAKEKVKKEEEIKPKLTEIKFKQEKEQPSLLPQLKTQAPIPVQAEKKKVLIEVLKEEQTSSSDQIGYEMKETQTGYYFQFLLAGVNSIKEVDLQMKIDSVRLRVQNKKELTITLKKSIQQQSIKAKFKKKLGILTVQVPFK